MDRWYFWILAPVMVAAGIIVLRMPTPPTTTGVVIAYVFSGAMFLATLGLASPSRFRWALRAVAGVIFAMGVAYFVHELRGWWAGKPAGPSGPSLFGATMFLVVFGIPALGYLLFGGRVAEAEHWEGEGKATWTKDLES